MFKDGVEIVRILSNAGANTDATEDQQGLTPLTQGAANYGTALQHTKEEGHCEIIELLVELAIGYTFLYLILRDLICYFQDKSCTGISPFIWYWTRKKSALTIHNP